MQKGILITALSAIFFLVACTNSAGTAVRSSGVDELAGHMAGHYTSAAQAAEDSAFFDIRLHMVPIWVKDGSAPNDTVWLYVEQAAAGYLDRPYRQRVYRLTQDEDGPFRSAVYTLDNPLRFAGSWREPAVFDKLSPDSLSLRDGCDILLTKTGEGIYAGSTGDKTCSSTLRGASYASSEVVLASERLVSWDRGWDSTGVQVWGAEKSGYIFDRVTAEKAAVE